MTLHNHIYKVHPIESNNTNTNNNNTDHNSHISSTIGNESKPTTSTASNEISSKPITQVNRKAFVIDNFDKSLELKNLDESLDDFSWVPKSPLTSETQYRPKSARNRYDQAFRIEENEMYSSSPNNTAYYKQAAFNHILNNSVNNNVSPNNNEITLKNDEKSVVNATPISLKQKPKSAPPHMRRNSSERKNPFAAIKGLLNMCKHKNHEHVVDDKPMISSEHTKQSSSTSKKEQVGQNITIEKTQVVVFDNRANREELPPSPQMNRRAKCGGYGNDDSNRDQPIIVPLYYHVVNAQNSGSDEASNEITPTPTIDVQDFSDSISDIQEL